MSTREVVELQKRIDRLAREGDVESLIDALQDPHEDGMLSVRSEAARHLGALRDPRAVPPLQQLIDDPNPYVRARYPRARTDWWQ